MLKTIDQLKESGWKALVKELGPAEATRFILQYQKGDGDYLEKRKKVFKDITLDSIIEDLKNKPKRRNKQ